MMHGQKNIKLKNMSEYYCWKYAILSSAWNILYELMSPSELFQSFGVSVSNNGNGTSKTEFQCYFQTCQKF